MDFETRKRLYNLCDPKTPVEPDDPVNVDLDHEFDAAPRGIRWADKLAKDLELADQPVCELITGLPGSGKSTELLRLARQLERATSNRIFPIIIDTESKINLNIPIDVPDLLAIIVDEIEQAAHRLEKPGGPTTHLPGFLARAVETFSAPEWAPMEPPLPKGIDIPFAMMHQPAFREQVRAILAPHMSTFVANVRDEIKNQLQRIRFFGYSGVLVIVDSLEKLNGGTTESVASVLASAAHVFLDQRRLMSLPVHVLYTVPPALVSRRKVEGIRYLPVLKLHTRDGEPYPVGLSAARALVLRRVGEPALREILGDERYEHRLEEIVRLSGGYPRSLIEILKNLISEPPFPVSDSTFRRVCNGIREAYRRFLMKKDYEWLARVGWFKELFTETPEEQEIADRMLTDNAVMRYQNDDEWFDLHPAVRDLPGVQSELRKLEEAQKYAEFKREDGF